MKLAPDLIIKALYKVGNIILITLHFRAAHFSTYSPNCHAIHSSSLVYT